MGPSVGLISAHLKLPDIRFAGVLVDVVRPPMPTVDGSRSGVKIRGELLVLDEVRVVTHEHECVFIAVNAIDFANAV